MLLCGTACASSRCQSDPEWSMITPFIHSSTLSCDQHDPFRVAPQGLATSHSFVLCMRPMMDGPMGARMTTSPDYP
jgi:hypothetical protein